jgi:hypothetical protein
MIQKTIELWGLQSQVQIESRNSDFEVTVKPPLRLRHWQDPPDKLNPVQLRIEGLSSLDVVIAAARAARDWFAKQVLNTTFVCGVNREQYEQLYEEFNALWQGWLIEIRGTITAEAENILRGGEFTEASPTWIPAMRWYEDDANAVILVSAIIDNGERHLEIATDGGSLEMLQERVAFLKDIRFTPIYPNSL